MDNSLLVEKNTLPAPEDFNVLTTDDLKKIAELAYEYEHIMYKWRVGIVNIIHKRKRYQQAYGYQNPTPHNN